MYDTFFPGFFQHMKYARSILHDLTNLGSLYSANEYVLIDYIETPYNSLSLPYIFLFWSHFIQFETASY